MFYAAAATVVLTFAALVAIVRTLHHTKRAADSTKEMVIHAALATKAAEESVRITEYALIGIERPLVVAEIIEGRHISPAGHTLPVRFRYTNYGRTPAILGRAHHKIVLTTDPNELPEPLIPNMVDGKNIPDGEIVSPGGGVSKPISGGPIIDFGASPPEMFNLYRNEGGRAIYIGKQPFDASVHKPGLEGIFEKPTFFIGYVVYASLLGQVYVRGFCFQYEDGGFALIHAGSENHNYNYDEPFQGGARRSTQQGEQLVRSLHKDP